MALGPWAWECLPLALGDGMQAFTAAHYSRNRGELEGLGNTEDEENNGAYMT